MHLKQSFKSIAFGYILYNRRQCIAHIFYFLHRLRRCMGNRSKTLFLMHLKQSFKSIAFGYIKKAMHCPQRFCRAKLIIFCFAEQNLGTIDYPVGVMHCHAIAVVNRRGTEPKAISLCSLSQREKGKSYHGILFSQNQDLYPVVAKPRNALPIHRRRRC